MSKKDRSAGSAPKIKLKKGIIRRVVATVFKCYAVRTTIALVCLVVSFIASIAFLVNSLIAIAMQSVHDAIQAGGVAVANEAGRGGRCAAAATITPPNIGGCPVL